MQDEHVCRKGVSLGRPERDGRFIGFTGQTAGNGGNMKQWIWYKYGIIPLWRMSYINTASRAQLQRQSQENHGSFHYVCKWLRRQKAGSVRINCLIQLMQLRTLFSYTYATFNKNRPTRSWIRPYYFEKFVNDGKAVSYWCEVITTKNGHTYDRSNILAFPASSTRNTNMAIPRTSRTRMRTRSIC